MNSRTLLLSMAALLLLLQSACAHGDASSGSDSSNGNAQSAAPAEKPHEPFTQLKGRNVSIVVQDRRSSLVNSDELVNRTRKLVGLLLTTAGAQILPDSPDEVSIFIDDFGERESGTMTQQCAKFSGRVVKKGFEFLPTEISRERCVIEGQPPPYGQETDSITEGFIRGAGGLSQVGKKADLGRAYGQALADLMRQLDHQAR